MDRRLFRIVLVGSHAECVAGNPNHVLMSRRARGMRPGHRNGADGHGEYPRRIPRPDSRRDPAAGGCRADIVLWCNGRPAVAKLRRGLRAMRRRADDCREQKVSAGYRRDHAANEKPQAHIVRWAKS
jgi:hypothetical protein